MVIRKSDEAELRRVVAARLVDDLVIRIQVTGHVRKRHVDLIADAELLWREPSDAGQRAIQVNSTEDLQSRGVHDSIEAEARQQLGIFAVGHDG